MLKIDTLTKEQEENYENFLLNQCSLVQHSTAWRSVVVDLGKDSPIFVIAKENGKIVGALPLYYFRCRLGNLLTSVAWHSISGIICSESDALTQNIYKAILNHCLVLAKEMDCTAISVATNPFLEDKEYYLTHFNPDYVLENFVQYIKLSDIFDEKGNWMHPNYLVRNSLTRNLKEAASKPIQIVDEQTQSKVDEWYSLHEKRMRELEATPIPKKLFDSALKNMIPQNKGKFLFVCHENKMISGGLFIFNQRIMDVYMMSMDSKYGKYPANYMLIAHMLKEANKNKVLIFNWQSSDARNSSLYQWKEQWGSREGVTLYLTRVLNDITQWRETDYQTLQEAYRWHYVLPFNLLKGDLAKNLTTKDELTSFLRTQTGSKKNY